jgi:type I restriction enzyme S subunit
METLVPEGYKKTKVGVIPNDWSNTELKNLISKDIQNGYSPLCPELENGSWILGLGALTDDKMNFKEIKPAPINDIKVKQFILKEGDFLISRSNTPDKVGRSGLFRGEVLNCSYPDLMMRFRIDENKVNRDYLEYYLKTSTVMQYIRTCASGSSLSMVKINKKIVENITILQPNIKEQEKIAEILTTWDNTIAKQIELIERKNLQKKALVQTLLKGQVRFDGFHDEWKEIHLSQVLKERKTYSEKGLEFEHVSLTKEGVVPKTERYERDQLVKDENKKYKITKLNDICYNPANLKFGVICKNTYGDGIFSPIYVTFEAKKGFDINFLGHFLTWNDFIMKVRRFEEGTVYERMAVNPKDFLSFKTKLPSLSEQQKIAEVLSLADDEINLLKNSLVELKLQKKALMQKLLTGEVRVKI